MKQVRCAIYTRKSSEEGLEQDFNSLHAQREACSAYVLSQASEGWKEIGEAYDDGGLSGGNMDRPGLQRLLTDIRAGLIDIVVVYKVDRLTRSLLDFAKLVEAFDAADTSFVSVTQSFNTTTSMGRLTLNMLLSFAQFEREVTAERIRDKIAASKAKGMWMGGTPPLGYAPDGRSLAIVEEHAAIIRDIFARYLRLGNVRLLTAQLLEEGIRAPRRQRLSGSTFGGVGFSRGQLYMILKNPVYLGKIRHGDKLYPGLHPAIISQDTWDAVQAMLADHTRGTRVHRAATQAPLAGKLVGLRGEPLIPAHASIKTTAEGGNRRYRYYVSRDTHHGGEEPASRIPAPEIEDLVATRLAALFADPLELIARAHLDIGPLCMARMIRTCEELAPALKNSRKREMANLVQEIRIGERDVTIAVDTTAIAALLDVSLAEHAPATITLTEQVRLTRTGMVLRLVDEKGCAVNQSSPDETLLRMLGKAWGWWRELARGEVKIAELARREGVTPSWLSRVVRLAFLSPTLVEHILDGTGSAALLGSDLVRTGAVPLSWSEQGRLYGGG